MFVYSLTTQKRKNILSSEMLRKDYSWVALVRLKKFQDLFARKPPYTLVNSHLILTDIHIYYLLSKKNLSPFEQF